MSGSQQKLLIVFSSPHSRGYSPFAFEIKDEMDAGVVPAIERATGDSYTWGLIGVVDHETVPRRPDMPHDLDDPRGLDVSDADFILLLTDQWDTPAGYVAGVADAKGIPLVVLASEDATNLSAIADRPLLRFRKGDFDSPSFIADLERVAKSANRLSQPDEQPHEPPPPSVFISYAHEDDEALRRLLVHLRPLQRSANLNLWSDRELKVGTEWREEIREAIGRCSYALLLVSADFLASDFIATDELPPILERAEQQGVTVASLILGHCRFQRTPELARFHAANDPAEPYYSLDGSERDRVLDSLARAIETRLLGRR